MRHDAELNRDVDYGRLWIFDGEIDAGPSSTSDVILGCSRLNSVSEGIESLATTRVVIRPSGKYRGSAVTDTPSGKVQRTFTGQGSHEDIVVASARAYTHALNRMIGFLSMRTVTKSGVDGKQVAPNPRQTSGGTN